MSDWTREDTKSVATVQENIDQAVDDATALDFARLAAVNAAFRT